MVEGERLLRSSLRFYRVLLLAYPREFRREYGPHLEQVFRDLCRDEIERGVWRFFGLWIRTVLDVAATALTEKCLVRRDPGGAAVLSFLWPGLGQLYNRQVIKGVPLVLFGILWLLELSGIWESLASLEHFVILTLVLIVVQIWSVVDARNAAERINASSPEDRRAR